jgi:hypothetical protein
MQAVLTPLLQQAVRPELAHPWQALDAACCDALKREADAWP